MKRVNYFFWGLIIMMFVGFSAQAQLTQNWNKLSASRWFHKKEWSGGLAPLFPHRSINKLEFARQYHANPISWGKAFSFLKDNDLFSLPPGRYSIDGDNVFAMVAIGPSRLIDTSRFESHIVYQDIHYIVTGREKIGIVPVFKSFVLEEYNSDRDIIFYKAKGSYYKAVPGSLFIFFPGDVHKPNIKIEEGDIVKRIVIKVRRENL